MKVNTAFLFALVILMLTSYFSKELQRQYLHLLESKNFLEEVDISLDIEDCTFKKIRSGAKEGSCYGAEFKRKGNQVFIWNDKTVTNKHVYDIMEDESFIWRRK